LEILQITKSKLRKELLNLYFTNPEKKYYLRELERILDFSVGNIRRELIQLKNTGLFLVENKGNLTYYYLNKSYPLLPEIKSIILKTAGAPGELKESLKKVEGVECAFIYGSFAKGGEKESSDIDLLIIGKIDEGKLIDKIKILEKKLQREINLTLYEKSDFIKKKKEGNPFILEVIKEKKFFLIGDEDEL
jgi:predicted nucleotidyltransferase